MPCLNPFGPTSHAGDCLTHSSTTFLLACMRRMSDMIPSLLSSLLSAEDGSTPPSGMMAEIGRAIEGSPQSMMNHPQPSKERVKRRSEQVDLFGKAEKGARPDPPPDTPASLDSAFTGPHPWIKEIRHLKVSEYKG